MVITFTIIGFAVLFLLKILQKNTFFLLYFALMVGSAYLIETYVVKPAPFSRMALMILLAMHFVLINIVTLTAYGVDKKAAVRGQWRVPEFNLHTLEFLGGWPGAFIAQKIFHHKNRKKSYQTMFWLVLVFQAGFVYYVLRILKLL